LLGVRRQVMRLQEIGLKKYGGLIEASTDYPLRNFGRLALFGNLPVGYTFAQIQPDNEAIKYCGLAVDKVYEGYGIGTALEYLRLKWAKLVDLPIRALVDPENGEMRHILEDDGFRQVGTDGPSADLPLCFDVLELSQDGVTSAIERFDSQANLFSFSTAQGS
jgi:GNAT superfamily N-acetyltransferase